MSQINPTDECCFCGNEYHVDDMETHPNFTHPTAVCEDCWIAEGFDCNHTDNDSPTNRKLMNQAQGKYIIHYWQCRNCQEEWGHHNA